MEENKDIEKNEELESTACEEQKETAVEIDEDLEFL